MNTTNQLFELFYLCWYENIRQEAQLDREDSKLFRQHFAHFPVKEHDISLFFFHRATCPQRLDQPCAGPASSIGSVGSLLLKRQETKNSGM